MTCTVTIALENFSLAAADTRLNLLENDTWTRMDARVGGFTLNSGEWLEIPNYYRKIRKINRGWAASTGDFVTAQIVLKALQSLSWTDETLFDLWVGERDKIRAASQLGSGFALDEIDKTQIIIAAPNPARKVQVLQLGDSTIAQAHAYICTMPPGVTQAHFDEMIGGVGQFSEEAPLRFKGHTTCQRTMRDGRSISAHGFHYR
jgi:hypothetical protein